MTSTTEKMSPFAELEAAAREAALKGCPELTFTRDEYNDAARPDVELIAHHTNGLALIIVFYADPATVYPFRVIEGEDDREFGNTMASSDGGWGFDTMEDAAEHITEKAEEIGNHKWEEDPDDD